MSAGWDVPGRPERYSLVPPVTSVVVRLWGRDPILVVCEQGVR